MKKLKIDHHKFTISLIFSILATVSANINARSLLMGTVRFPHAVTPIRIYYGGKIIPSNTPNSVIQKVTFEIPRGNRQNRFYVLITEEIGYQLKKILEPDSNQNTVDYLKVVSDQPYKFYVLDLIQDTSQFDNGNGIEISTNLTYHWEIHEKQLPESGQIPDATIVICYFPELVAGLKGGSNLELPTIILRSDILEQAGSQEKFTEKSIRLQLASINSDTIHAPTKREIRSEHHRILIAYSMT